MHKNGNTNNLKKEGDDTSCFVCCRKNKGVVWRNIDSAWLMEGEGEGEQVKEREGDVHEILIWMVCVWMR